MMQRIKDFDNLQKDLTNGAIILTPSTKKADIQVDNLVKQFSVILAQNREILEQLKEISTRISQLEVGHK